MIVVWQRVGLGFGSGWCVIRKKTAIIPNYEHTTSSDDMFGDESILIEEGFPHEQTFKFSDSV